MLCFVCNVRTEVSSHNTMPSWVVFFVKLFFDKRGNIFLNVKLFKGLVSTVDCVLLYFFCHISIFNNCFSISLGHLDY